MTREYHHYIEDMLTAFGDIETFVAGMDRDGFAADRKTCLAVIRCLEIVGEAAKILPEHIRADYPSIPWKRMAGMRDKLIHGYFGVDMDILWVVITEDLPPLKTDLARAAEALRKMAP